MRAERVSMRDALRLDFFVAIVALLVSALTAGTLIYQTHVIGDQYAATIWPYVSATVTYDAHGESVELTNDGLGPALVQSAQLWVDGKRASSWSAYFAALAREPVIRASFLRMNADVRAGRAPLVRITASSVSPGTTIRPGDSLRLISMSFPSSVPLLAILKHPIAVDTCYCSLNGNCWTLSSAPGASNSMPHPVAHCTTASSVNSTVASP